MCTTNQAIEILGEVYRNSCDIFSSVHDAYLYGSYARGDCNEESDVDILLIATLSEDELSKYRSTIASVSSDLSLKYDVTVSITVKPLEQFKKFQNILPYYRIVIKEGIRYAI